MNDRGGFFSRSVRQAERDAEDPAAVEEITAREEARVAEIDHRDKEKVADREQRNRDRELAAYHASPVGQAEIAYGRGDQVFQYSQDVMSQKSIVAPMVGTTTSAKTGDPSAVLNAVCAKGWELVTGSFVFVHESEESRNKLLASGQQVAIKGRTVAYYLFRRRERPRAPEPGS